MRKSTNNLKKCCRNNIFVHFSYLLCFLVQTSVFVSSSSSSAFWSFYIYINIYIYACTNPFVCFVYKSIIMWFKIELFRYLVTSFIGHTLVNGIAPTNEVILTHVSTVLHGGCTLPVSVSWCKSMHLSGKLVHLASLCLHNSTPGFTYCIYKLGQGLLLWTMWCNVAFFLDKTTL